MTEVLVLVDHSGGQVSKSTLELLTIARELGSPSAVFVGEGVDQAQGELAEYGAEKIYAAAGSDFDDYLVAPVAELLAELVSNVSPAGVLIPSSSDGKEIAARLGIKTSSGVVTDAVAVAEGFVTTQSVFAGSYTVTSRVVTGTPIVTVKPNSVGPSAAAASGSIEQVEFTVSDAAKSARITATEEKVSSGRPELTEASIVVSGGRGTGGDFSPVEAFADSLDAAVGASRAAVDAGWYPHSAQVGQTGKTVSPQLYVAAGISGAIQHRAGMQTSKTIVAVNKDDEAPIFELVDYGVVGDLFDVLPQASEAVKQRKG